MFNLVVNISFNAAVADEESGFNEHLVAAIKNLASVGILCNLGVMFILESFLFISLT